MFEGHDTLWVIHISKDNKTPLRARDEGFVCIGWTKMGDLSRLSTRKAAKQAMIETWPDWKIEKINSCYGQVYRFAHEMRVGDPVVYPLSQTREIAIGRIKGEYRFASADAELVERGYANVRTVDWLKIVPRTVFSQTALHSFGSFSSVSTSNDHLEEVQAVLQGEAPSTGEGEPGGVTPGVAVPTDQEKDQPSLYDTAVQETEDYLLKSWHSMGSAFEPVVAAVLEAIGYSATVTSASGDHGVDVIAHPDRLGLQPPFVKIQVKSGSNAAGEPEVTQLIGSVFEGEKGIFISLGGFTSAARATARNSTKVNLIDAKQFVSLFLDHYEKLDPTWQGRYPLKRVYVPQS